MNFMEALSVIKAGKQVRRPHFHPGGCYESIMKHDEYLGYFPERWNEYNHDQDIVIFRNVISAPTIADYEANDWEVVE